MKIFEPARKPLLLMVLLCYGFFSTMAAGDPAFQKAGGYRGIWYSNQETKDEYVYKYSGGLGTYCADHIPLAVYAPAVKKTFFVYGGVGDDGKTLLEMAGYYDHRKKKVCRPTIVMDKGTSDAHDNPVIAIDGKGHVWIFASAHGTSRPAYIFKSKLPYSIDDFEEILKTNFSYPQPWWIAEKGFLFLHTLYQGGRMLFSSTSPDGAHWSAPHCYSRIDEGHYQVTWPCGERVGAAFNYHPYKRGLNYRTNVYYIETADMGATWTTVNGVPVETPMTAIANPGRVHDYAAEKLNVYLMDLNYDAEGRPIILYLTSKGWEPGPQNAPYTWWTAHWTGREWNIHAVGTSDHNYDMGSLYVEKNGTWRIIGPMQPGPQPYGAGGEIVMKTSNDQGATWSADIPITANSPRNHTYVRRPLNAHPGFYAFWADGDARKRSESRLYFYDKKANRVMRLPDRMDGSIDCPEEVSPPRRSI